MKPRILISSSEGGAKNYTAAIEAAGGEAFVFYLPETEGEYDGLLLCGGGDIDPSVYGQENIACDGIDVERDEAEFALVKRYVELGKPILGICRGHQVINVAFGGTMIQDVGEDLCLFHKRGEEPVDRVHPVRACEGSFLFEMFGQTFPVNSSHHQAVDKLGEGLRPAAWAESGLVEALEHERLPIRSVQWHPERISYENKRPDATDCESIFDWFIRTASGK